jgi:hypothetical protein
MITLRPLPTLTTTLLLLLAACTDDDSSATTNASSTSTGPADPSTDGSTVADPTAADTSTGAPATDGSGSSTGSTGAASSGSGDTEATTGDSTGAAGLEIAGEWLEEFSPGEGITHSIDETTWAQVADFGTAVFHVDGYDNAARFVVAQGDAANEFYADLYSRFDWTWDGDALYYCTAVFDAATAQAALAAPPTDPSDLAMGCGGFPWSALVPIR